MMGFLNIKRVTFWAVSFMTLTLVGGFAFQNCSPSFRSKNQNIPGGQINFDVSKVPIRPLTGTLTVASQDMTAQDNMAEPNLGDGQSPLPLNAAASNNVLWPAENAIDGNLGTSYSSQGLGSVTYNPNSTYLATWLASPQKVARLRLYPRKYNNEIQAFPRSFQLYKTAPDNSSWRYEGYFVPRLYPASSIDYIDINLRDAELTYGFLLVPEWLGADSYGNTYFQLAEIKIYSSMLPTAIHCPLQPGVRWELFNYNCLESEQLEIYQYRSSRFHVGTLNSTDEANGCQRWCESFNEEGSCNLVGWGLGYYCTFLPKSAQLVAPTCPFQVHQVPQGSSYGGYCQ